MEASNSPAKSAVMQVGEFLQAIAPKDMKTCTACTPEQACQPHTQEIMKRLDKLRQLREYDKGRKV